ncbi:MAG: HTTM domain-containing protein [Kofleriaceae bacterium]
MTALAVLWMARAAALATTVAALELIVVHRAFGESGVYRWSTLRRELPPALRAPAGLVFSTPGTWLILVAQLASGLALPWTTCAIAPWIAFAATLLIAMRFRGSYNGGSDSMLVVVLLALAVARTDERFALAGLGYAAVQLVMSYAISGWAKVRDPQWRTGTALDVLVRLPHYGVPPRLVAMLSSRAARPASFAMLAFECAFPIALADVRVCVAMLAIATLFHLTNAVVFGLNRFLWAWLAAFPALLFWVARLHA